MTDTDPTLPRLRAFRVRRQTGDRIEELVVFAHQVLPQDQVLIFIQMTGMGDQFTVGISRAFCGWLDLEELPLPAGSGSVQ